MCSACICCPSVWRKAPAGWGWACRWRGRWRSGTGGRLLLDSKVGQGTCVTLALPDQRTDAVLEEPRADYAGGFQPALLELADGLPFHAYRQVHLDE